MAETPRLNGVIRALEEGKPAFTTFAAAEISVAQAVGAAHYDGVVFEMEHRAYDIRALRDCLQYMLDRRQIVQQRQPGAGRDAIRADSAQWRRDQPMGRQAGARPRGLRHRLAACQHRRGGAQRSRLMPLSAPAHGRLLRARRSARRCSGRCGALLGPLAAGILRPRRCVAAQPEGRGIGCDHVRGGARDPQSAENARRGARRRRRHHR